MKKKFSPYIKTPDFLKCKNATKKPKISMINVFKYADTTH